MLELLWSAWIKTVHYWVFGIYMYNKFRSIQCIYILLLLISKQVSLTSKSCAPYRYMYKKRHSWNCFIYLFQIGIYSMFCREGFYDCLVVRFLWEPRVLRCHRYNSSLHLRVINESHFYTILFLMSQIMSAASCTPLVPLIVVYCI